MTMKTMHMPSSTGRWLSTLGLAFGALVAVLPATEAVAQVRPAYVKNVDEPGRAPYQQLVSFNTGAGSGSCLSASFCLIAFNAVPAGKRLVVEHVSILIGTVGAAPNLVTFGNDFSTNTGNVAIVRPDFRAGPAAGAVTFWSLSEAVRVYFEPGQVPRVKLSGAANFGFVGNASLHGYLIDAAN
jgi:hypothetical protein